MEQICFGLTKDELTKGGPFYFLNNSLHAPYKPLYYIASCDGIPKRHVGQSCVKKTAK
jgi:hypothetical protein